MLERKDIFTMFSDFSDKDLIQKLGEDDARICMMIDIPEEERAELYMECSVIREILKDRAKKDAKAK